MKQPVRILLLLVAVICLAAAVSYPLLYRKQQTENTEGMEELARLRRQILEEAESESAFSGEVEIPEERGSGQNGKTDTDKPDTGSAETDREGEITEPDTPHGTADEQPQEAEEKTEEAAEEETEYIPQLEDLLLDYVPGMTWKQVTIPELEELDAPTVVSGRTGPADRTQRNKALPFTMKEKVQLKEDQILPELKHVYALNRDTVGWLFIEDTVIDYPVLQREDDSYYLEHDFYGQENVNGQIILDPHCDPYTPSYNCVISGHHMRSGSMFGNLQLYQSYDYWAEHKLVRFDSLMEHRTYLVIAAFFSADYDEYEEGFRYNRNIVYEIDAKMWLEEIDRAKLYDTGADARFGDEFITLTTCDRSRRQDGRFVLIGRRVREGENIS